MIKKGLSRAVDTYAGPEKQFLLLDVILHFIERLTDVVKARVPLFRATELPVVVEIHRLKFTQRGDDPGPFKSIKEQIDREINALLHRQDT
jgi:vacuolar-type H+-ATPase catalytic subunit A/Vma1